MFFDKTKIERTKYLYPVGTRIELDYMDDPYSTLKQGDKGTVVGVDDAAQILMKWDSGSSLALIPDEDSFRKICERCLFS